MDNARRYGGWGFLFVFGLMLIVVGFLGRGGAMLGAILVPDSLIVDSDVDTSGTAGSWFTNIANAAAEGR